jgi:signal transduction histidine kinase/integral membrane sensor domain MASE1
MAFTPTITRALPSPFNRTASPDAAAPHGRTALGLLLVCAAYLAGSHFGLALRLPPGAPSPLWPPNAILTAALLLTHPRHWALYLLAALPAHLLAQSDAPWPRSLVWGVYLTNCSEALIGAWAVRKLSDAPDRLNTLRRMVALLAGAVILGPFLSSFLDAAVFSGFDGQSYSDVWMRRLPSNILTELAFVPAILAVGRYRRGWFRALSDGRRAEVAAFGFALLGVAALAFAASAGAFQRAAVSLLLPLVVWAVVRFGPAGLCPALLTTVLVVIWAGTREAGLVGPFSPRESVAALQVFLAVTLTPLLCLSALIEERRADEVALALRRRFEELLSGLSRAFLHLRGQEMPAVFQTSLQALGQFFGADGVLLLRPAGVGGRLSVAYAWSDTAAGGVASPAIGSDCATLTTADVAREWAFSSLEELGEGGLHFDRTSLADSGVAAAAGVPLLAAGRIIGAIVLVSARPKAWPPELSSRLTLASEALAHALARNHYEEALHASETVSGAILSSLSSYVAVLDRAGRVIAVNDSWDRAIQRHEAGRPKGRSIDDYLELCALSRQPATAEQVAGINAVLDRRSPRFTAEHHDPTAQGERWYAISVVPLNRPEGGAVVSHTDITDRRQAESVARERLEELAHLLRVSTMGGLTTAIAHELNQPLTSILANAQTARHLLGESHPDIDALRAIVSDLIEEDKRAGEVIRRLRDLLSKGQRETVVLDLNPLAGSVARIVGSDAMIRGVSLRLDLSSEPLMVGVDRVQIQQVLLNLALNAMEAMEDSGTERILTIRSSRSASGRAVVEVVDTGKGIGGGAAAAIFQPFYTTKPNGMGMGLSIARSIAEAHRGAVDAFDNPAGGATFRLSLPMAAAERTEPLSARVPDARA